MLFARGVLGGVQESERRRRSKRGMVMGMRTVSVDRGGEEEDEDEDEDGRQRWADGWMDGWMAGWMEGWADGWLAGSLAGAMADPSPRCGSLGLRLQDWRRRMGAGWRMRLATGPAEDAGAAVAGAIDRD